MNARYPQTLPAVFDRALSKYADRPAISDGDRTLRFDDLDRQSARFAVGLVDRGVAPGDHVALLHGNSAAYPMLDLGLARAATTRVPLDIQHTAAELTGLLVDAGARTVVCDRGRVDAVAAAARDAAPVERVIITGGTSAASLPDADVEWVRFEDVLVDHTDTSSLSTPDPEDVAAQFYTGGTTGEPKGVRYSHRCLVANLLAVATEFGFGGDDAGFLSAPLSHSAGTFCDAALLAGGQVHLRARFDPETVLSTIDREGVTWTFLVPTMLYRLLDADVDLAPLAGLDRVLYGAAPIRTDRLREAIERVGPIFHQFYGQTEVPNLITSFPPQEHARAHDTDDLDRLSSAGTACLRSTVEIRDRKTDERCPHGEVGEVVVAAPYTFDGYHDRPAETAAVLRDGWVYTGDVGVLDENGYLTLVDRDSGVIVTGGMNVYSQTVERAIRDHPGIEDVAVVGVPDDEWGEAVHAVIITRDEDVSLESITEFLDGRLASYKQPKSVSVVDSLPTTRLGKVDRQAVRDRFWDGEERSVH